MDSNSNAATVDPLAAAEAERAEAQRTEERPVTVEELPPPLDPELFREAGGFIGAFYDCGVKRAPYPNPPLFGVASLVACAGLAGHGYRTPGGVWPNIFTLAIGDTGCGKEAPLKLISSLYAELDEPGGVPPLISDRYGGKPKSGPGFQDELLRNGVQVFGCDEVADLLAGMNARGAAAPGASELSSALLDAFSKSDGFLKRRAIKKAKDDDTPAGGWNLQASLVGSTQPAAFWESITERNFASGFIGRCLIVEAAERARNPVRNPLPLAPSPELVAAGRAILDANGRTVYTNGQRPEPWIAVYENDAADDCAFAIESRFNAEYDGFKRRGDELGMTAAVRGFEKVLKVALLHAVSSDPQNPRLTLRGLQWAETIVTGLSRRFCALARRSLAGSRDEKLRNKFLAVLRKAGGEVSQRDLFRAAGSASRRELDAAIEGLLGREQVEIVPAPPSGKPGRPAGPLVRLLC